MPRGRVPVGFRLSPRGRRRHRPRPIHDGRIRRARGGRVAAQGRAGRLNGPVSRPGARPRSGGALVGHARVLGRPGRAASGHHRPRGGPDRPGADVLDREAAGRAPIDETGASGRTSCSDQRPARRAGRSGPTPGPRALRSRGRHRGLDINRAARYRSDVVEGQERMTQVIQNSQKRTMSNCSSKSVDSSYTVACLNWTRERRVSQIVAKPKCGVVGHIERDDGIGTSALELEGRAAVGRPDVECGHAWRSLGPQPRRIGRSTWLVPRADDPLTELETLVPQEVGASRELLQRRSVGRFGHGRKSMGPRQPRPIPSPGCHRCASGFRRTRSSATAPPRG